MYGSVIILCLNFWSNCILVINATYTTDSWYYIWWIWVRIEYQSTNFGSLITSLLNKFKHNVRLTTVQTLAFSTVVLWYLVVIPLVLHSLNRLHDMGKTWDPQCKLYLINSMRILCCHPEMYAHNVETLPYYTSLKFY